MSFGKRFVKFFSDAMNTSIIVSIFLILGAYSGLGIATPEGVLLCGLLFGFSMLIVGIFIGARVYKEELMKLWEEYRQEVYGPRNR